MKSICFKKLQQPTKSTLFPYTTLFRSLDAVAPVAVVPSPNFQAYEATVPSTDRKSTRLNSSHVEISYAVFCLKKKIGCLKILSLIKTYTCGILILNL